MSIEDIVKEFDVAMRKADKEWQRDRFLSWVYDSERYEAESWDIFHDSVEKAFNRLCSQLEECNIRMNFSDFLELIDEWLPTLRELGI